MKLWNGSERVEAEITTEHSASSYGLPVLVVDRVAYGTADAAGWYVLEATAVEEAELRRAGYDLPGLLTLARDLGYECGMKAREAGEGAGNGLDDEGVSLMPVEPLPGDWRYLAETLDREATGEEERAFAIGWRYGAKVAD